MSIIPHAYHYFDAFGLCLRRDSVGEPLVDTQWEMSVDEACSYIEQAGAFLADEFPGTLRPFPTPTAFYVMGSDPFFRPDELDRMLKAARRCQMVGEVWTTGAWVDNAQHARSVLQRYVGNMHAIILHTSRPMLAEIGIERIEALLIEARRANLGVSVRCAVGPEAAFPKELLGMEIMNADTSLVQVVPTSRLSDGAVRSDANAKFLLEEPPRHRRCAELFAFIVAPGGDVFPCARGIGVPGLCLGSLRSESVREVMARTLGDQGLRKLRDEGPYHLYEAIRRSPAAHRLYPGYVDTCHFHHHALTDPGLAELTARASKEAQPRPLMERRPFAPTPEGLR